ncbi:hypothetical protein [Gordonia asplenii]|nr:hypothetical protein [Gordonia asplenii]
MTVPPEDVAPDDVAREMDSAERAERIAHAVLSVLGVVRLDGGRFGEVATYLPGRRVTGVSLDDESGEVHIVVAWPATDELARSLDLLATAENVRAVAQEIAGVPITVTVEDIVATGRD